MDWLMQNKLWLNFACNSIMTISFLSFLLFVFGRSNSIVHKFSLPKSLALKAGLSLCATGSLYNAITFSDPPLSEVVLNSGLAVLFTWASLFHHERFVTPVRPKNAKKRQYKN